jgi:hypothetical protein
MDSADTTPNQPAPTLLRRHPLATVISAIGVVLVLAHVVLGPSVVPPAAMLVGLGLALSGGARLFMINRHTQRESAAGHDVAGPRKA